MEADAHVGDHVSGQNLAGSLAGCLGHAFFRHDEGNQCLPTSTASAAALARLECFSWPCTDFSTLTLGNGFSIRLLRQTLHWNLADPVHARSLDSGVSHLSKTSHTSLVKSAFIHSTDLNQEIFDGLRHIADADLAFRNPETEATKECSRPASLCSEKRFPASRISWVGMSLAFHIDSALESQQDVMKGRGGGVGRFL